MPPLLEKNNRPGARTALIMSRAGLQTALEVIQRILDESTATTRTAILRRKVRS